MSGRKKRNSRKTMIVMAAVVVVIALVLVWQSRPGYHIEPGFNTVQDAYQYRQTGMMAEVSGIVARMLVDDRNEPDLQKFIIRLPNGQSLLVVHNQKIGERVPVAMNDTVLVRGEYQWTETGGTLKHTERDYTPHRRHGWIDHRGERYD
jgi:hypothetical protein